MSEAMKAGLGAEPQSPKPPSIPLFGTKAEAAYLETRSRILTGALSPGLQVNAAPTSTLLGTQPNETTGREGTGDE
jgi:hypothetical protein